jgi:DNA-binding transcriptional LysR family regulator
MTKAAPGWELYRSFLAVIRERSLSGAARTLSLTQPTVGRHIDALEEALGLALFTRSQAGLDATTGAVALIPYAEAMASAADAIQRVATGEADEDRGAVRISASEMVGAEVLPAGLAAFREAHPRVVIELVLSNRNEDLLRREADIAVRMVRPTQEALVARKIGIIHIGVHVHPRYVKTHGVPRDLAELAKHPVIGFDKAPSVRRLDGVGVPITRDLFSFRCDSDYGQYQAIRAGVGLGFCQVGLARRDGLVPVLARQIGFQLGVWVVMHRDLRRTRRMRLMFDHLAAHLAGYIASQTARPVDLNAMRI